MARIQLADILPPTNIVQISQGEIEFSKVDLKDVIATLWRHPAVVDVIEKRDAAAGVSWAAVLATAPTFISEMICLSLGGNPKSAKDMSHVDAIAAGDQLKLAKGIFELTFPDGISDFFGEAAGSSSDSASASPGAKIPGVSVDPKSGTAMVKVDPEIERLTSV
ncbi:hypothetical protein PARHAE_03252 [Paracoccus haematequi]|uniref:Uncharacterized protein n=1 Tax=Paracoccus haematequi TaxID=2491866 RepID=A0A3S4GQ43_9RHOB|nr:hypothetical protein [Paracoccus haematequi]VDS10041.1 hypothetical protein PARHAE_03252 [Paracoccus haematequi]